MPVNTVSKDKLKPIGAHDAHIEVEGQDNLYTTTKLGDFLKNCDVEILQITEITYK